MYTPSKGTFKYPCSIITIYFKGDSMLRSMEPLWGGVFMWVQSELEEHMGKWRSDMRRLTLDERKLITDKDHIELEIQEYNRAKCMLKLSTEMRKRV
jgi:hypothetical protein